MAMHSIKERPAPGPQMDAVADVAEKPVRVEHPPQAVIRFWGFMMTALSEKAWNLVQAMLPFACLGSAIAIWFKFMPDLDETKLYGLITFSVFSLALCWIGRRVPGGDVQ